MLFYLSLRIVDLLSCKIIRLLSSVGKFLGVIIFLGVLKNVISLIKLLIIWFWSLDYKGSLDYEAFFFSSFYYKLGSEFMRFLLSIFFNLRFCMKFFAFSINKISCSCLWLNDLFIYFDSILFLLDYSGLNALTWISGEFIGEIVIIFFSLIGVNRSRQFIFKILKFKIKIWIRI